MFQGSMATRLSNSATIEPRMKSLALVPEPRSQCQSSIRRGKLCAPPLYWPLAPEAGGPSVRVEALWSLGTMPTSKATEYSVSEGGGSLVRQVAPAPPGVLLVGRMPARIAVAAVPRPSYWLELPGWAERQVVDQLEVVK